MTPTRKIFTIGHSTHSSEYFIELLNQFQINCLIDVRSMPASKFNPQFNQLNLKRLLQNHDIVYMHFKEEFGARREKDKTVLDKNGRVCFDLVHKTKSFQKGVERVEHGISKGFRIALMCAESNPLECHRFSMISSYLHKAGFEVCHILKDKTSKTHAELETELLKKYAKKSPN